MVRKVFKIGGKLFSIFYNYNFHNLEDIIIEYKIYGRKRGAREKTCKTKTK